MEWRTSNFGKSHLCLFTTSNDATCSVCFIDVLSIVHLGRKKCQNFTAFSIFWERTCLALWIWLFAKTAVCLWGRLCFHRGQGWKKNYAIFQEKRLVWTATFLIWLIKRRISRQRNWEVQVHFYFTRSVILFHGLKQYLSVTSLLHYSHNISCCVFVSNYYGFLKHKRQVR